MPAEMTCSMNGWLRGWQRSVETTRGALADKAARRRDANPQLPLALLLPPLQRWSRHMLRLQLWPYDTSLLLTRTNPERTRTCQESWLFSSVFASSCDHNESTATYGCQHMAPTFPLPQPSPGCRPAAMRHDGAVALLQAFTQGLVVRLLMQFSLLFDTNCLPFWIRSICS